MTTSSCCGGSREIFVDEEQVARLGAATTPDEVAAILGAVQPA